MLGIIYKIVICTVIALSLYESYDYLLNDVLPSPSVAVTAMLLTSCLLFERLYVILYLEQFAGNNKT